MTEQKQNAERQRPAAFLRYRPRVLTLVLLASIATTLTLANLSFDQQWRGPIGSALGYRSYGWPLIWHRFVTAPNSTVGWYYSPIRMTADLAIWLLMLVAPTGACEWTLRRYRPRLRWSLKAMLAAVALIAVYCAWFVAARERANLQDALIAEISGVSGDMWVERSGPKWLDLLGVDRYRRRIIGADLGTRIGHKIDEEYLKQIARSYKLRYLLFEVDHFTPGVAVALRDMPGLQILSAGNRSRAGKQ